MTLPRIEYRNGQPRLLVDERPFLILGLQWDCDSCFSPAEMNPLFPHAVRLGANTVVLPTYWREIEPKPGHFTFAMVDERLQQARAYGLRLILLWFATWKNASPFYAPDDVRNDPVAYPRALDRDGQPTISLCPSAETTWARDCAALVALFRHLREVDDQHTVIMVQIENEPGILGSDRCYCPACTQRFIQEHWVDRCGSGAPEAFSAVSIARYIDRLAGEAKAIYPLPVYFNVWLAPAVGGIPGRDYPAGGAVPDVLDLVRQELHHVDLVAPDIYTTGFRDFHRLCQAYRASGNPLYIAEHSSSPDGRADRNVFYAIGQYGALGFDLWAIDASFPERQAPPLVDPIGGEWGPQAFRLRDSYVAIARAIEPIVDAQGTDRIFVCVQEEGEMQTGWVAKECDILINYEDRDRAGRGLIIQRDINEFLLIGVGFTARFRRPRPDGRPIPVRYAEWGYFERDSWYSLHPVRREQPEIRGMPIALREPGVARVVLDL